MNFLFLGLMLLMLLAAIAIIIFPLLRARSKKNAVAYKDSNVVLYEEKLAELDIDLAESRIDQERYRIARQELDRELLDNVPAESAETASEHYTVRDKKHPALALAVAVFVPAFALLMYWHLGTQTAGNAEPAGSPQMQQPQAATKTPSVEAMTAKLEKYLQTNKGSVQDWTMLGRAYKYLKRYEDSIKAFDHALKMQPDNAQLMLETAEAIALHNGQVFNQAAFDLVMQAQKLQPDNVNVLWFAGVADYQMGHYRGTIMNLSRLAAVAKSDKEVDKSVRFYLEKARNKLIAKGEVVASVDKLLEVSAKSVPVPSSMQAQAQEAAPAPAAKTSSTASGASLHVAVNVSPDVRAKFSPDTAVFVYAKAAQGPPMPLAVQRMTLAALPAKVTLDDSMAMMAGMNLSAFPQVVVSARISRSGSASAQSGDYIGDYKVNDVHSAKDVINININKVVP
jgi:cytochrome c-type biogenesis protein CcmH